MMILRSEKNEKQAKTKNTTPSEQFGNPIKQIKAKSIPITHIYMTAHCIGLVHVLQ